MWLRDRKQKVVVDGEASSWAAVKSGVPQGSVLGPLLFIVYINDIDDGIENTLKKFADDTKLIEVGSDTQIDSVKNDLIQVEKWAEKWQMQFNVEKCKIMHIGASNKGTSYEMANKKLAVVKAEKDLGVIVDDTFKVGNQCLKAAKKGNQILGMVRRTFTCKNEKVIINLYKALVRPHLDYSIQAWRPHLVKDKEALEKVQRRATKMVSECKGLTYLDRLKYTGLTTLEIRRERADMLEVYKILYGLEGVQEKDFFIRNTRVGRGHPFKLFIKRFERDIAKYSFGNRVCSSWNSLPHAVVTAPNVNAFKNRLNTYLGLFVDFK